MINPATYNSVSDVHDCRLVLLLTLMIGQFLFAGQYALLPTSHRRSCCVEPVAETGMRYGGLGSLFKDFSRSPALRSGAR
jgi:hypothetical protein